MKTLQAVADEMEQLHPAPPAPQAKQQPKRQPLPASLPRLEIRHEPGSTTCAFGCQMERIGEDVAEKLDYVPGVFTVERHIRGRWACAKRCEHGIPLRQTSCRLPFQADDPRRSDTTCKRSNIHQNS